MIVKEKVGWMLAFVAGLLITILDLGSRSDDAHFVIIGLWLVSGGALGLWLGERVGKFLFPVALMLSAVHAVRWMLGIPTNLNPNSLLTIGLLSVIGLALTFLGGIIGVMLRKSFVSPKTD